jgi:hypothetical protein
MQANDLLREALHGLPIGHVNARMAAADAMTACGGGVLDQARRLFERAGLHVRKRQMAALRGEPLRECTPHPRTRPRNDRDPAEEHLHCIPSRQNSQYTEACAA